MLGCGGGPSPADGGTTLEGSTGITTSADGTTGDGDPGDGDPSGDGDPAGDGDGDGDGDPSGPKFDLGTLPDKGDMTQGPTCKVVDDMDAVGDCEMTAPPDAFEPEVQWSFMGQNGESQSMTTALVANLTDDNDDGEIDLCDVPEVIIGLFAVYGQWNGHLYALDGETGAVQWQSPILVDTTVTPAIGDIDDDGLPEIVALSSSHHARRVRTRRQHGLAEQRHLEHDLRLVRAGRPRQRRHAPRSSPATARTTSTATSRPRCRSPTLPTRPPPRTISTTMATSS